MRESIKRILVGLGNSQTATSVTQHAIEIARPREAELVGMAVTDPVRLEWTGPRPMGVGVEEATSELRKSRFERAAADIAAAEETFATRCREAGVSHRINDETGDPFAVAEDLVRYNDMCVFGLNGLFEHGVVPEPVDALERLVSAGVRPVLAVAEEYREIKRVLVAYSGSIESAKTFKHFAAYFQAHDREVDTDHCQGEPFRELLPYAEAWKADLIVAGNSAKNLLLRKLFGETALRLLRESPLPLYLAQ